MNKPTKRGRWLGWITLVLGGIALAGCQHIHDPWVHPAGSMQSERNVGIPQQQQLATRQWTGQSDR